MKRVLIIGGYGNFGTFISKQLAGETTLRLIIAGRSFEKAKTFADAIGAEAFALDINQNLKTHLQVIKPDIVIHTSGPFQSQSYQVAKACIGCGAHYIDLADGREFVAGITELDPAAKQAHTLVVSGASSVPCLTAALIDDYREQFSLLEHVDYGITTAQKTTRGLATTAAILSYTGKAFKTIIDGKERSCFGWQNIRSRRYGSLGRRFLGSCNVPDLALFPKRYPELKTLRFYAGLEIPLIHITLWLLSWLVRLRLIKSLEPLAPSLLKLSFLFDWLGSANSGFHMECSGKDSDGKAKRTVFEIIAREGDGPFIPCIPAILLAKKLANEASFQPGATPCVGMITKTEYLAALKDLNITWSEEIIEN